MATCGTTPLASKLGIKEGRRVAVIGGPAGLASLIAPLPTGATLSRSLPRGPNADLVIGFAKNRATLERECPRWTAATPPDRAIWVAWPKKASGVPTDLTENVVRAVALAHGLVDVKVCAIDETWSGLKLVVRVKDRPG